MCFSFSYKYRIIHVITHSLSHTLSSSSSQASKSESKMMKKLVRLLIMVEVVAMAAAPRRAAALSMDYYGMSCPFAEMVVRSVVSQALMGDPSLAASLLRLHFHDCFVQVSASKNTPVSSLLQLSPSPHFAVSAPCRAPA